MTTCFDTVKKTLYWGHFYKLVFFLIQFKIWRITFLYFFFFVHKEIIRWIFMFFFVLFFFLMAETSSAH